jgi:hypothetical protein
MTREEFWDLIAATKCDDADEHAAALVGRLAGQPPDEIVDFEYWWGRFQMEAYRRDLWAAAHHANGGCSHDGFLDFRCWLILQGREAFERVVADPNALADLVAGGTADGEFMCECDPAFDAWLRATGVEYLTSDAYAGFDAAYEARHPEPPPGGELGEPWDFYDPQQIQQRLPRFFHE